MALSIECSLVALSAIRTTKNKIDNSPQHYSPQSNLRLQTSYQILSDHSVVRNDIY